MFHPLDHPICLSWPQRLASTAWAAHVPFAMFIVDLVRPRTIVELGVYSGVSYCAFCQSVKELNLDTRCYGIDSWQGDANSGPYGPEILSDLKAYHDPLYENFSCLIKSTFDEAVSQFEDSTIDLLHIDGYHSYEAAKNDFERWLPKMSSRGVVLFHDTNVRDPGFGVWKLWDELKLTYPHFEFVHEHGLGVVSTGTDVPAPLREFFEQSESDVALTRDFFYQLGQRIRLRLEKDEAVEAANATIARLETELSEAQKISAQVSSVNESSRALLADRENSILQIEERVSQLQEALSTSEENYRRAQDAWAKSEENYQRLQESLSNSEEDCQRAYELNISLNAQIEELENINAPLLNERKHWERNKELLSAQLSAKSHELERITQSTGWKVLTRYGQFKYRHLLPLYRLLRLPPYQRTRVSNNGVSRSPFDASPVLDGSPELTEPSASHPVREIVPIPLESNACDVICFPIIDWDFRFQRPQQLMSRFADAGHRVFYVAASTRSSGPPYRIEQKRKNVYEVSLRGFAQVLYSDVMGEKERDALFDSLQELRRDGLMGATIAFAQLPFWWPLVSKARDQFAWPIIYDCMDHHAGFSTNHQTMLDQEQDLTAGADLVVVSSLFLEKQAQKYKANVLLLPNACDYEHFAIATKTNREGPVIGYYGAIADWFDSELLVELAQRRPDWNFVLVGSTFSADISALSKLPNVHLPGEKHYAEIPGWLDKFDVAIIPFKRSELTEATNPVKVYEILASGRPLVSVPIPEVAALEPLVRLASTAEEFDREIAAALMEADPELVERRRAFARENTWEKRYETLAPAVCDVFPKASIIVVTYHNLELNRLCLESIYARTEWPNFEVIVVDNNSTDGTPEYLREAETIFPNLKVILNDKNFGFAAGNNLGLRQATGEYLVLLNNDTVVSRGWLSALIRHLHNDPGIGIIGPVTNMIGNEAKVEVDYTDVEKMPAWAANYVRQHDGEISPIPMLAMFCLAIRKEVFDKVGFLDEQFGLGLFEDDDYTHRVKINGFRVVCAADSFVHHFSQASFKKLIERGEYQELFDENRRRYERKWNIDWVPHQYAPPKPAPKAAVAAADAKPIRQTSIAVEAPAFRKTYSIFQNSLFHVGRCNICGKDSQFFYDSELLYRESLTCGECLSTSRYRSIARGILRAISELTGIEANSLAELDQLASNDSLAIYETQPSFYYERNAYPIPDLLAKPKWIDVKVSTYRPKSRLGSNLGKNFTNQNLEKLTFPDNSFNLVITSDVMEHVRLDQRAHKEIRRVLKPGGVYLFTVPHFREKRETLVRVGIVDESDPSQDKYLMEKEYHGDGNSPSGKVLSYRAYGTDLDEYLTSLGFEVDYCKTDFPEIGILNTELFYCRLTK